MAMAMGIWIWILFRMRPGLGLMLWRIQAGCDFDRYHHDSLGMAYHAHARGRGPLVDEDVCLFDVLG
jgi:hypothetical protein